MSHNGGTMLEYGGGGFSLDEKMRNARNLGLVGAPKKLGEEMLFFCPRPRPSLRPSNSPRKRGRPGGGVLILFIERYFLRQLQKS